MKSEIFATLEEISNIETATIQMKKKVEETKGEIKKNKEQIAQKKLRVKELKNSLRNVSHYISLGEAEYMHCENKVYKEEFGLVVVNEIALLVWRKYKSPTKGRVTFEKRKMHSICLCGSFMNKALTEENTICEGFGAKKIIDCCIDVARERGIKKIFARSGDESVGKYKGLEFHCILELAFNDSFLGEDLKKYAKITITYL